MEILGKLLIAPPAIKNNFWHKTVIMVTEHHAQGSLGLVLNKPSNLTIVDFGHKLNMMINIPGNVYVGGPINSQSLTVIHSNDWSSTNTMRLNDTFSVSSAEDILPRFSVGDCPRQWRLFLGMCGWGTNQLVSEMKGIAPWNKEHSWCTATANLDLAFDSDGAEQWCSALDHSAQEFAENMLT
jgi:putative transcriptional regulator